MPFAASKFEYHEILAGLLSKNMRREGKKNFESLLGCYERHLVYLDFSLDYIVPLEHPSFNQDLREGPYSSVMSAPSRINHSLQRDWCML